MQESARAYPYRDASHSHTHAYLLPTVTRLIEEKAAPGGAIFDLGCGNGSASAALAEKGYAVTGVDPSEQGIAQAKAAYPHVKFAQGSAYDDLPALFGVFDVVVSLEVVEHVYSPRVYASTVFRLLKRGGIAVISTPYHGYLKNLALAASGKMDAHFTALWDNGHIKFWSERTLSQLLRETGFDGVAVDRVGRIKPLAKSMIAVATRP